MRTPDFESGAFRDFAKSGIGTRNHSNHQTPQQYRVTCTEFRAFDKNTLQGFATLAVEPPGLAIQGCLVHSKNGRRWVNLPAKQYVDEYGVVRWQNLIALDEGSAYWRFQEVACEAIDAFLETAGIILTPGQPADNQGGRQDTTLRLKKDLVQKEGDANGEFPF